MKPGYFPACLRDTPIALNLDTVFLQRFDKERRGRQEGDTLVIPVVGVITHRPQPMFAATTSTIEIAREVRRAEASPRITRVVLDVDSPGGAIGGVPELADLIHSASKPVTAVINAEASGTAYWLAAQSREIVVTPSGAAGGIGIVTAHDDLSDMMSKAGIARTFVHAGKHKMAGNPFSPLSVTAEHHLKKRVDELHNLFIQHVARGRGVSEKVARRDFGMGRMLSANHAVSAGLVDAVGTLDEALSNPQAGRRAMKAQRFRRAFA